MLSHKYIRDEFGAWALSHLNSVDSETWSLETRWRGDLERVNPHKRNEIMGDPWRFIQVIHRNDVSASDQFNEQTSAGVHDETPHNFIVELWLQFEDADTYADSSQKQWDEIVWGGEDNEPASGKFGIIPKIRNTSEIQMANGRTLYFTQPPDAPDNILPMESGRGGSKAHYTQFRIELAAQPTYP